MKADQRIAYFALGAACATAAIVVGILAYPGFVRGGGGAAAYRSSSSVAIEPSETRYRSAPAGSDREIGEKEAIELAVSFVRTVGLQLDSALIPKTSAKEDNDVYFVSFGDAYEVVVRRFGGVIARFKNLAKLGHEVHQMTSAPLVSPDSYETTHQVLKVEARILRLFDPLKRVSLSVVGGVFYSPSKPAAIVATYSTEEFDQHPWNGEFNGMKLTLDTTDGSLVSLVRFPIASVPNTVVSISKTDAIRIAAHVLMENWPEEARQVRLKPQAAIEYVVPVQTSRHWRDVLDAEIAWVVRYGKRQIWIEAATGNVLEPMTVDLF